MLKYLYIKDFIIINEIHLDLQDGFSAFTGETGAGKSIMVDAISLLCGQRISGDLVSKGKSKSIIEGVFDFSNSNNIKKILEDIDVDINEDVIITREIKVDGKSSIKINHRMVNLSIVKEIMDNVLDIHSQHDNQYLLKPKNHINLLNSYLNEDELIYNVEYLFKEYKKLKDEMDKALNEVYNPDDLDFFQYEVDEINNANLKIGEDEEIEVKEKEYSLISKNLEKLNTAISIYENDFQDNFFRLNRLTEDIDIKVLEDANQVIKTAYYDVDDALSTIKDYLSNLEINEEDINLLQERAYEISRLKRKYGGSIKSIFEYREDLLNKIQIINNRQEYLDKMSLKVDEALSKFNVEAKKLSDIRYKKALLLDKEIESILNDLMLPNARFKTSINSNVLNKNGIDDVEFLISMNKGEDLKPLSKVASGGELSRLMLGLKVIFSKLQGINTIIFDEIDTGVSGPVASAIGFKMKELSKYAQVFSITHLAQVASCANHHYHVSKSSDDKKTSTIIKVLNNEERINELAILSTGVLSDVSKEAAKELLRKNQEI